MNPIYIVIYIRLLIKNNIELSKFDPIMLNFYKFKHHLKI